LTLDEKRAFVDALATQHGQRLRRFLLARVRNTADASDLVQEVYLRLLRVEDHETIRVPEAYVFALANHVLYQYRLRQNKTLGPSDLLGILPERQAAFENDPLVQFETAQRIAELAAILSGLSPKARATLLLHRRDGLTLEQIGQQLGISRAMAKKYLANALLQCRRALESSPDSTRKDAP
jgi:RNA polymerase sigma factor (sigma-70 family)